jgi:spermidine synthase
VVMAELVPAVVAWNRGPLSALAGRPLDDKRVVLRERDVLEVIRAKAGEYDAILLDVDNGPAGLVAQANNRLYAKSGLRSAFDALRPDGFLAVWSSDASDVFTRRLRETGFEVELRRVRARGAAGGARYVIWVARRP